MTTATGGSAADAERAAAFIAAWGLETGLPRPPASFDEQAWSDLLDQVAHHRLSGLLHRAVRDGVFDLDEAQARQVAKLHGYLARRVMHLEGVLVEVTQSFHARGIDMRVLKGPALANTVYDDPQLRPYIDLDVLVRGADFDRAVAALEADGARRLHAEPRRGFVARFGKSTELVRPDGVSVDLHRALAPGAWATLMQPDRLFEQALALPLPGGAAGLGAADRFVHACFHATVGSDKRRLLTLRDVVQTAACVEMEDVLQRATLHRATAVVALAVREAWASLRPVLRPQIVQWAEAHEPDAHAARLIEARTGLGADHAARDIIEMARSIPGPIGKARYLGALVLPSRRYRRERQQSIGGRLATGVKRVVQRT